MFKFCSGMCSFIKLNFIKKPNKKYMFILTIISLLLILFHNNYLNKNYNNIHCYTNNNNIDKKYLLSDISLNDKKPIPGKSIFFHETSCSSSGIIKLTARQACAIESSAKLNPNWDVFVLFASPVGFINQTELPLINSLLSYNNIYLRNVDLWKYSTNTPAENWITDGQIFKSLYMNSHVSDFLRYLSLWKWGGTYLDLDVIVKKSLDTLMPNYAGAESENFVAAGILNFDHKNIGHEIAEMCLREFLLNFNGRDWGNNGPGVITRVLQKICFTKVPSLMQRNRCHGYQVYPVTDFYAIGWKNYKYFFDEKLLNETLKIINDSIIVHVWNKISENEIITIGKNVGAYGVLAQKYCPKVYSSCGKTF